MSWQSAEAPEARTAPSCKALETVIVPRPRDIGGFEVRRVLPSLERRSVGPFVFFDQMGRGSPGRASTCGRTRYGLATVTIYSPGRRHETS